MNQTWYVGPLAAMIGDAGGDIGNQFTFGISILAYLPLRWLELKHFGR